MIEKIKELRGITGAGVAECKQALASCNENIEEAVIWLRKNGSVSNRNRTGKATTEGIVGCYIHTGNKICVMVEVGCETDFVARNEEFKDFAHEIALHIAAANPSWIKREDVPQSVIDSEKDVIMAKTDPKKPQQVIDKIVQGKLDKFFKDECLLEQVFVKDSNLTIQDKLDDLTSKIKENIVIKRFTRYEVGG